MLIVGTVLLLIDYVLYIRLGTIAFTLGAINLKA